MRIAHVIPTYVPAFRYGGPIRAVHGLAAAQGAAGDDVAVFTTDRDGPDRLAVPLGKPVAMAGHRARYFAAARPARAGRSPRLAEALAAALPAIDVLHLHSVFLGAIDAAGRAARDAGRPYVLSPRGMLDPALMRRRGALRKRLWLALAGRKLLAGAGRIVATSAAEAAAVAALGIERARIAVVPNGVDPAELAPPAPEEVSAAVAGTIAAGPYALYLGRLSWKKRLELLIEALSHAPALRLVVAGPDDEGLRPALERRAAELGLDARVDFTGEVDGADRRALLAGAAVLALVSVAENFGNAVLEAMACGVPVVVTQGVGLAPEVAAAGAGRVVEGTPAEIGAALAALAGDPAAARAMGERGRRAVAERYAWPAVAARMRDVYREAGAA